MANGVRYGLAASVFTQRRRPRAVGGQEARVRHRLGERAPLPARLGDAARRLQGVRLRQGHVALLHGGVHPHQACRGEALLSVDVSAAMRSASALDRSRLEALLARELERFAESNPQSRQLFERAKGSLLGGVPMSWMAKWAGGFPLFLARGDRRPGRRRRRPRVRGLLPRRHRRDGRACAAGDRRGRRRAGGPRRHCDASERGRDRRGEELSRRFGLTAWQFTLSATDANRFAIRLAREITQRPKILVFDYCYHGTVDETFATLDGGAGRCARGQRRAAGRPGADHESRAVERRRRARAGAGARGRGVRARRAGADEHRHRAAGARLPRRPARSDTPDRNAPRHRRDAHVQRGTRRLHGGLGARAGSAHDREGNRRRRPRGRVRRLGRCGRADRGA